MFYNCNNQGVLVQLRYTGRSRLRPALNHRRELESSQRFKRQFETKIFGLTFTHANLLRVYFWVGAITLVIIDTDQGGQSSHPRAMTSFNRFFKDPLGRYQFEQ